MKVYRIQDFFTCRPIPVEHYFMDVHLYDTPKTLTAAINNLPGPCVKVSVRHDVGRAGRQAARLAGIRVGVEVVFT